jgi:lysophospholipase L1-like esterase
MKIVFLGDSLTWGGYGGNFVDEIARRLPDHEIINEGEGGDTIINLLERVDKILEQKPDGIFVMVGGNDAISYTQPETRRYYRRAKKIPDGIVTPEVFGQTYRNLLTHIQLNHVLTWVGLPPVEYNPEVAKTARQYNELASAAAQAFNIPTLDLMVHFAPKQIPNRPPLNQEIINLIGERSKNGWSDYETERKRGSFTFTFDGLHLTPETAKQVGALIVEFLDLS